MKITMSAKSLFFVLAASAAIISVSVLGAGSQPAAGALTRASAAAADSDSISSMLDLLAYDQQTGLPRSRFCFREALLGEIADSLSARLERYTGNTVIRDPFQVTGNVGDHDSTFTTENIIANINASGTSYGKILLTAHYDAIGSRTPGWWDDWQNEPAPGANDNGTGVAAVMEAARVLAKQDLHFDIGIILFSAEELGRKGSEDYVDNCDAACSSEIIGVINVDMIGTSPGAQGFAVWTDFYSVWLTDILAEATATLDPSLKVRIINPGPWNSDHASFYAHKPDRIPAVSIIEPVDEDGFFAYQYYHTVQDLPDKVDIQQVKRTTDVLIGALEGLATKGPEISIKNDDILFVHSGNMDGSKLFDIDEPVSVRVLIRNTGGMPAPEGTTVHLSVMLQKETEKETIYSGYADVPDPLRFTTVDIPLDLDEAAAGGDRIWAEISVGGFDDSPLNNSANTFFAVEGGSELLVDHHFSPNPIKGSFPDARFCVELAKQADLKVEIYTLEGVSVGKGAIGYRLGIPLDAGYSCHDCSEVFPQISKLASGIYLYRIKCFDLDGGTETCTGRFAVEN